MRTTKRLIALATVAAAVLAPAATAAAKQGGLSVARGATASFHDIGAANAAGYVFRVTDVDGIACIDEPGTGGMGVHYAKPDILFDDKIDAATPELLVYEPRPNGGLRLVAVEYFVFKAAWDANHGAPPSLFGRQFEEMDKPNRYGVDEFYELHAWVWRHNPLGMFDDWNPRVSCDAA
jgi:hypothetical protein